MPATPPSPPPSSEDLFSEQLRDVKAHLDRLQASISQCEASMCQTSTSRQLALPSHDTAALARLTLPSGPLFWQLFNSLRSDFQGLDTRVNGLEQDVDALEDRVDRLEPDRLTPAGSTTSQEDSGGVRISRKPNLDLLGASMACLPELCSEQQAPANSSDPLQYDPHDGSGSHAHNRVASLQSQQGNVFSWQPAHSCYESSAARPFATPIFTSQSTDNPYDLARIDAYPQSVPTEGVAFRDREIARMDDQLKTKDTTIGEMQIEIEDLRTSYQELGMKLARDTEVKYAYEEQIRRLTHNLDARRAAARTNEERQQKRLDAHVHAIAERDRALQYWQKRGEQEASVYHHTIADRDQALQRWRESYNAVNDAWWQESERCNALESTLEHFRDERRKQAEEMEEVQIRQEREMDKLHEFCEHKDAVIVKQERVMLRGGDLLEERDAELDRLQRSLRIAEDDKRHEGTQQKRMARLLDESRAELEMMKRLFEVDDTARVTGSAIATEDAQAMAASSEAVDGGDSAEVHNSSTRNRMSNIREGRRDVGQERRAHVNESRRSQSPRARRVRRRDSSRHLPLYGSTWQRHERRPSPPPRPQREERRQPFVADKAETPPQLPDRPRRAADVDDIRLNDLPAPPPVTARKMVSEANLRSPDNGMRVRAGRSISKHQSMQELPRRHLQAYVETEGESEAERNGRGQGEV